MRGGTNPAVTWQPLCWPASAQNAAQRACCAAPGPTRVAPAPVPACAPAPALAFLKRLHKAGRDLRSQRLERQPQQRQHAGADLLLRVPHSRAAGEDQDRDIFLANATRRVAEQKMADEVVGFQIGRDSPIGMAIGSGDDHTA